MIWSFSGAFLLTSIPFPNPRHIQCYEGINHRLGDVNRSGGARIPASRPRSTSALNLRYDIFLWPTLARGGAQNLCKNIRTGLADVCHCASLGKASRHHLQLNIEHIEHQNMTAVDQSGISILTKASPKQRDSENCTGNPIQFAQVVQHELLALVHEVDNNGR